MQNCGNVELCLDIEVITDSHEHNSKNCQAQQARIIVSGFGAEKCNSVSTLMECQTEKDLIRVKLFCSTTYQQSIGIVM